MDSLHFVRHDFSLRSFNTFGIEVTALAGMDVTSTADLFRLYHTPSLMKLPRLVVGGGSNLLLTKGRFDGLVLNMAIKGFHVEREDEHAVYVSAGAGEKWHDLVQWTLENGWGGLENLSWIPGTVGAAPVQNIGAYGVELQDCFFSLKAFDFRTGRIVRMNKTDCRFAYRHSVFKEEMRDRMAIVDVTLMLPKTWTANIAYGEVARELAIQGVTVPTARQISETIVKIRRRKLPDPAVLGNAGSFFKNPVVSSAQLAELKAHYPDMPAYRQPDGRYRVAAGWLIDRCGWKGRRLGRVGVCETQALVLVNHGGAQGADIVALAGAIQKDVFARFAIRLEPEPVFV